MQRHRNARTEVLNVCPSAELFVRLALALVGKSQHWESEAGEVFREHHSGSSRNGACEHLRAS